jgi:ArsR family transcriptional regulator
MAELYKALGDPIRLRILAMLKVREACVCEMVERLPVSQPAVSQHLRRLKQAGLVRERRQKYWTYYALRPDLPALVAAQIRDLPDDAEDVAWLKTHRVEDRCAVGDETAGWSPTEPGGAPGEAQIVSPRRKERAGG